MARKVSVKPGFGDGELLMVLSAQDFMAYLGETQYGAYLRANHLDLFPNLVDQSQFNRRGRNLQSLVETLRQSWVSL